MTLLRTPLHAAHQRAGGKLIEFGGWEMPVQYTSIVDEHLAVRRSAGVFDISHMGEVQVRGRSAAGYLNRLLTNDIRKLGVGQGQYTLMCREEGGVVDDLYAYRLAETEFLLIVNASRIDADFTWMQARLAAFEDATGVELLNLSQAYGAIALQGPRCHEFIDAAFPGASVGGAGVSRITDLVKNQIGIFPGADAGPLMVARTGYTGEDGFEIVARAGGIEAVWERVLAAGSAVSCKPAGLGARDTLRTEMGYPLYGHELDERTTPIEASLGFFVALDKGEFCGRSVLEAQKTGGVSRRCVAFRMPERSAPPRPQYPIWTPGETQAPCGLVVSGTQSPSLGVGIGMGFVPTAFSKPGTAIEIEIRGRRWPATVARKPLWCPTPLRP